jgi:hypothetical protein
MRRLQQLARLAVLLFLVVFIPLIGHSGLEPTSHHGQTVSPNSSSLNYAGSSGLGSSQVARQRLTGIAPYQPATFVTNGPRGLKSTDDILPGDITESMVESATGLQPTYSGQLIGTPVLNHIPLKVNVIIAGIPSLLASQSTMSRLLPTSYTQVDRVRLIATGSSPAFAEYDLSYNFITPSNSFINGYSNFVNSTAYAGTAPPWMQRAYGVSTVAEVNAGNAEDYLWTNLAQQYSGYTVMLLYPTYNNFYFYDGSTIDPDTQGNYPATSHWMVGYGGAHPMLFADFNAGPDYRALSLFPGAEQITPFWMFNPTNQTQVDQMRAEAAYAVRYSIIARFIPSFLYEPVYRPNYAVNVTLYSLDPTITWSNFIKPDVIQQAFAQLQSLSSVQVNVNYILSPAQTDPDFYNMLQSATYTIIVKGVVETVYNAQTLHDYILSHLYKYASPRLVQGGAPVYVLPIIIVAGGYFVDEGFAGKAEGDNNGNFAFVLDVINSAFLAENRGLTILNLHEAGHAFGLAHPHDFYDPNPPSGSLCAILIQLGYSQGECQYWLWDSSRTPMTYQAENLQYDLIAQNNLDQGLTAELLNQTILTENLANQTYNSLGYGILPPGLQSELNMAEKSRAAAIASFSLANPDFATAAKDALDAWTHANNMIKILRNSLLSLDYDVTDSAGLPLVKAHVRVMYPNSTTVSVLTDALGQARLHGLPWGSYRYVVTFDGNTVGGSTNIENASGTRVITTAVYPLSIPQLLSTDGDAVHAVISLTAPNGTMYTVQPGFIERQAQNGTWTVSVSYEGLMVFTNSYNIEAATILKPSVSASKLVIEVTDVDGRSLPNAPFTLAMANGTSLSLVTDATGKLNLGIVPDGDYSVSGVNWQGIDVSPPQQGSTHLSKATTVNVKAEVFTLKIKVSDFLGLTVSGATVTIHHPNGTTITSSTDGSGVAIFKDIPQGDYSGTVSYLGQTSGFQAGRSDLVAGISPVGVLFSPASLSLITVLPGAAIGGGVYLVRRKTGKKAKPGQVPGQYPYPPGQQPYPPGQYPPSIYPPGQYGPGQYPAGQYQYPPGQPQPQFPQTTYPPSQYPQYQPPYAPAPQPSPTPPPANVQPVPTPSAQTISQTPGPSRAPAPQTLSSTIPIQPSAVAAPQPAPVPVRPTVPAAVPTQPALAIPTSPAPVQTTPPQAPQVVQAPRFCPMCGTKAIEGSKFCHSCGHQF